MVKRHRKGGHSWMRSGMFLRSMAGVFEQIGEPALESWRDTVLDELENWEEEEE